MILLSHLWACIWIKPIFKAFIAALFTIVKTRKQLKYPSINEWSDIYSSAIKRNEIMSFAATWVDLEMIIIGEPGKKINII